MLNVTVNQTPSEMRQHTYFSKAYTASRHIKVSLNMSESLQVSSLLSWCDSTNTIFPSFVSLTCAGRPPKDIQYHVLSLTAVVCSVQ